VKTKTRASLKPVRLEIPDHWTPETAFAVFELINDLRDQIWSRSQSTSRTRSADSSCPATLTKPPCPQKTSAPPNRPTSTPWPFTARAPAAE